MDSPETPKKIAPWWLASECAGLFLGVPLAYYLGWLRLPVLLLLVIMTAGCWLVLEFFHHVSTRELFKKPVPPGEWRRILLTYAVAVPGLIGLLWWLQPDLLFSLLRLHPKIWLLVMFAYPIISVVPQEIVYRAFFFARYGSLLRTATARIVASALVFSFGHIVFQNWLAVALTFPGGLLFARTYQRTSSLLITSVEHAWYGCAIFTIGYGQFFFEGTLRWFPHK